MAAAGLTPAAGVCRDCLAPAGQGERCPACASPRLLRHAELDDLAIAHIDCDAFYATIEKRDNPALADRPVIVGGGRRGVVATACYIARTHGVRSAMPMFKALNACPQAVVIAPDMAKYAAVGREVRSMMLALTPLVEPVSIDEAFLDLSGTARLHGASPARILVRFALAVEREIGIAVSVGLSHNKFLAKIASDLDKPRGFAIIGRDETEAFLADKPVGLIWGVGAALQDRLARDGLRRLSDLRRAGPAALALRYGTMGKRLGELAFGRDVRPVVPERDTKSISAETTFASDLARVDALDPILWQLCEKVAGRAKAAGLAGRTAVLKLKTAQFRTLSRQARLPEPTQLADTLYKALAPLLEREIGGTSFRLIGAGLTDLTAPQPAAEANLFGAGDTRQASVEAAIDDLRSRFGPRAIDKGRGFSARPAPRRSPAGPGTEDR